MHKTNYWLGAKICLPPLLALTLVGCGANSTDNDPLPSQHPEFLYATGNNEIVGFTIDPSTGDLTNLTVTAGPKAILGVTPSMVVDTTAKFLYMSPDQNDAIDGFSINAVNGALLPITGSPFPLGAPVSFGPYGLAMDPSGNFLYAANVIGVAALSKNNVTGVLISVSGSPFVDSSGPYGVLAPQPGKFVYTIDLGVSQSGVSGFNVDPSTGGLTQVPGSPFPSPVNGYSFASATDASGRFLYESFLGPASAIGIVGWDIDGATGSVTLISGSPFMAGPGPTGLAVHPTSKFLYVGNASGTISCFSIDSSTGALSAVSGSPFTVGAPVSGLVIDHSGQFLYAANAAIASSITGFNINLSTGALSRFAGPPSTPVPQLTIPTRMVIAQTP